MPRELGAFSLFMWDQFANLKARHWRKGGGWCAGPQVSQGPASRGKVGGARIDSLPGRNPTRPALVIPVLTVKREQALASSRAGEDECGRALP